ncbi:MAG: insulinase family protein [Spirochaetales bacterium]|nr:insulinase family protein [Spirochaetales bacterium]
MDVHAAYTHLDSRDLPDYNGAGTLYRHEASGAEVFHLANDDPENMFSFAFATYPEDSTGVAHILEHTVLSGSERFPVKDPFLQLLKGSVNTFLNAMTYPDKTVYPAASPVAKDLFNMMKVYGDAVFFPLLKGELFRQEGHRLQFDDDGALERTGIVYNEMKGNYSSHDSVVGERCFQSLFPDTIYRHDSGGDPAVIPELTYEQFVAFHRRYYHPSNVRIVLYGNIPTNEYLEFLHTEFLSRFEAQPPIVPPMLQPRWTAPRLVEATYPLDGVEDLRRRSSVTMNWLLFPVTDAGRVLATAVLSDILLGHSGSPLTKALIDSGIGQDLSPVVGLEVELREAVFSVGLRGTDGERKDEIETLVLDTLRRLADEGIPADAIEGSLRRVEFSNREMKGGPNGLRVMNRVLRGWMYGGGPMDALNFGRYIAELRESLAADRRLFEKMIAELLLDNRHRSTVIVRPDAEQSAREREALERELNELREALSTEERRRIEADGNDLATLQETPDDPAALAEIPFLRLADIPREVRTVPYDTVPLSGGTGDLYLHREFTNGILYVDVAFDFGALSPREESLLNLLGAAYTEVGLPGVPHERLNELINLSTGGISAFVSNQTRYGDLARIRRLFVLRLRVLDRTWREGAELFARIVRELDFSDERRLAQVLDELIEEMQSALIPSGHYFAGLRAASGISALPALEEEMNGVTQLSHLQKLADEMKRYPGRIGGELNALLSRLLNPALMNINITGADGVVDEVRGWTADFATTAFKRFSGETAGVGGGTVFEEPTGYGGREYLLTSASVSYVTVAFPGALYGDPLAPAQDLLAHLLRTGPLWERIRMRGGAYGAFASSRPTEGLFSFASYRDPHTVQTLETYRETLDEMAGGAIGEEAIELAKVNMLGRELRPLTPRDAGFVNFKRRLHDIDDALRQHLRDSLRDVGARDIRAAAAGLLERFDRRRVVILGGSTGSEQWRATPDGAHAAVRELGV